VLFFNWAPCHEGVLGSGGIAPHIHDLGTGRRWAVSFTPWTFYTQGKNPWYPLDRRLGGPQSQSGCGGEEKNSQPLPRLEPSIIQPIAQCYTTQLFQLPKWIAVKEIYTDWYSYDKVRHTKFHQNLSKVSRNIHRSLIWLLRTVVLKMKPIKLIHGNSYVTEG
jgi:hypothetical protein